MIRMRIVIITVVFFTTLGYVYGQGSQNTDSIHTLVAIDSMFLDHNWQNWSIRIYSNVKEQRAILSNGVSRVSLVPNNPFGIGIGVASRKIILDLGFNIKTGEEYTERFDIQGQYLFGHHQMDFFVQLYEGFNVNHQSSARTVFRDDIKLQSSGIRYLYLFKDNGYSFASLTTGLVNQKKTLSTFGVGGFILQYNQKADSSIVHQKLEPSFNEQGLIVNLSSIGMGASFGFLSLVTLSRSFILGFGFSGGIGLNHNVIITADNKYIPKNPILLHLGARADIGYSFDKFYIYLSVNNNYYGTDLDFGNWGSYNQINAKVALGFRLFRKKGDRVSLLD